MTTGMTTRSLERSRISLPRAGLGALLAGTLLAGALLGAAAYAGITAATSNAAADAASIVAPLPKEPAFIRDARIKVGNGPLVGDTRGAPVEPAQSRAGPQTPVGTPRHASGHGPLE